MKKICLIAICLAVLLLLCSINMTKKKTAENTNSKAVTFINGAEEADVWILPQTEEILKTTLWGTATEAKVRTGESRKALIQESDGDIYVFRMIDTGHFYYSANGIELKEGWTLKLQGEDLRTMELRVTDETGSLKGIYEVFSARL